MPANTTPIFPKTPRVAGGAITPSLSANVKSDGAGTIGTDMLLLFTPGSNGSFVQRVRVKAAASAAATSTSATVIRIFASTQSSGATTNANTQLIGEIQIPSVSAANATGGTPDFDIPVGFAFPSDRYILACTSVVAATNTSFGLTVIAGDF